MDLKKSDRIEITVLMDNYSDVLIPSGEHVERPPLARESMIAEPVIAEHGLSLFIKVFKGDQDRCLLMDAGWTAMGLIHNIEVLKIDLAGIEAFVLSHGHMDHFGGLGKILELCPPKIPLILHPDALLDIRFLRLPDGKKVYFPSLDESSLTEAGASLIKTSSPLLLVSGQVVTTGEVERVSAFEKGLPDAYLERDGKIESDLIRDDQSLIMHLEGRGLVVVSGCAHSGIINTVRHARKITGIDRIYAVVGGFHLSGPHFEPIINETIRELKEIDPAIVIPMHCTGFKATAEIFREMNDQFILSSVGARFIFNGC